MAIETGTHGVRRCPSLRRRDSSYVVAWNVSRIRPGDPNYERFMPMAIRPVGVLVDGRARIQDV